MGSILVSTLPNPLYLSWVASKPVVEPSFIFIEIQKLGNIFRFKHSLYNFFHYNIAKT